MATRDSELVTYYKADLTLRGLVPGGIYADSILGVEGITDRASAPSVWASGRFNDTLVVRQGALVPTGQLTDIRTKTTHTQQTLYIYAYSYSIDKLEQILDRVYTLTMSHKLDGAWPMVLIRDMGPLPAPDLPQGVKMVWAEYQVPAMRRAV